jgi:hypothetical protein
MAPRSKRTSFQGSTGEDPIAICAKPKTPLTAYNMFFKIERQRILEGKDSVPRVVSEEFVQDMIRRHQGKPKRLHRKTHGQISFLDLARTIGSRWKKIHVDSETRLVLEQQAAIEKEKYDERLEAWKVREDAPERQDNSNGHRSSGGQEDSQDPIEFNLNGDVDEDIKEELWDDLFSWTNLQDEDESLARAWNELMSQDLDFCRTAICSPDYENAGASVVARQQPCSVSCRNGMIRSTISPILLNDYNAGFNLLEPMDLQDMDKLFT